MKSRPMLMFLRLLLMIATHIIHMSPWTAIRSHIVDHLLLQCQGHYNQYLSFTASPQNRPGPVGCFVVVHHLLTNNTYLLI